MEAGTEANYLQTELAGAITECIAAMNAQFLALINNDPDLRRFDLRIATANERRQRAINSLQNHVGTNDR